MADETAGDPMSALKWTRKSTRKVSRELKRQKIPASPRTVARLLKDMDFSLKANRKIIAGTQHPDRDQQFKYIAKMKKRFEALGQPRISVDSKKKELIGNFYNPGRLWCRDAPAVSDHDFRSAALGIANSYGIYDPCRNDGMVVVGISYDTPEFAVDGIVAWLTTTGMRRYPEIEELLILCDSGGSNGCRAHAWKYWLQQRLCNVFNIAVTVCHYPTGASKWNPIEHRMFSQVSLNWAGKPLRSFETMLKHIRRTTTDTGLKIQARINKKKYVKGIKIDETQISEINIRKHQCLPEWNYTIYPKGYVWSRKTKNPIRLKVT
jgi:hypothetical protein